MAQAPLAAFAVPLIAGPDHPGLQRAGDGERLDGGAGLERVGDRAVAHPALAGAARIIGVYRGHRGQGQDLAVARVQGHRDPGLGARSLHPFLEGVLEAELDELVQGQVDVVAAVARDLADARDHHLTAARVLQPEDRAAGAAQEAIVGKLDALKAGGVDARPAEHRAGEALGRVVALGLLGEAQAGHRQLADVLGLLGEEAPLEEAELTAGLQARR